MLQHARPQRAGSNAFRMPWPAQQRAPFSCTMTKPFRPPFAMPQSSSHDTLFSDNHGAAKVVLLRAEIKSVKHRHRSGFPGMLGLQTYSLQSHPIMPHRPNLPQTLAGSGGCEDAFGLLHHRSPPAPAPGKTLAATVHKYDKSSQPLTLALAAPEGCRLPHRAPSPSDNPLNSHPTHKYYEPETR